MNYPKYAFPDPAPSEDGHPGMTLREWYAGMALAVLVAVPGSWPEDWKQNFTKTAVELADALIAELAKEKP